MDKGSGMNIAGGEMGRGIVISMPGFAIEFAKAISKINANMIFTESRINILKIIMENQEIKTILLK